VVGEFFYMVRTGYKQNKIETHQAGKPEPETETGRQA